MANQYDATGDSWSNGGYNFIGWYYDDEVRIPFSDDVYWGNNYYRERVNLEEHANL